LRREVQRWKATGDRQAKQFGQMGDILLRRSGRGQVCAELLELGFGGVLALEPRGAFKINDGRVERTVLMMR
jgi:hypothetical protein